MYGALLPEDINFMKANPDILFFDGVALRQTLKLFDRETPIVKYFIVKHGLCHPDDISELIIKGVWCKVHGKFFSPNMEVIKYKNKWKLLGRDPATMEIISSK